MHPCVLILVAYLGAEDALVLEVGNEIVVDFRRDEGGVCHRRTPLVAGSDAEGVTATCIIVHAQLATAVEEVGCAAVAIAVVGSHTVAHVSLALHAGVADAAAHHRLEA